MKPNNNCLIRSRKLVDLQLEANQEGEIKINISKISMKAETLLLTLQKMKGSPSIPVHVVNFITHSCRI